MFEAVRVLLVDDSLDFREYLRDLLDTMSGIEVVGVGADGFDALVMVERLSPEIVVMDVEMPVLGGLEATRRLKRKGSSPAVVVMTSHDGEEYRAAALAAGADAFQQKALLGREFERTLLALAGRPLEESRDDGTKVRRRPRPPSRRRR